MKRTIQWLLIAAVIVLLGQCTIAERRNNANINPDVFPAFRKIERDALQKYDSLKTSGRNPEHVLSRRELWVVDTLRRTQEEKIGAEDYYDDLLERDYDLPPFYSQGYRPTTPWAWFWKHARYDRRAQDHSRKL